MTQIQRIPHLWTQVVLRISKEQRDALEKLRKKAKAEERESKPKP